MVTIVIRNTEIISGLVFTWFRFLNMESDYKLCHNESFVFPCLTNEECNKQTELSKTQMENLLNEIA